MKNKIFNTIFTLLFLTANAGLCEQPRTAVMPAVMPNPLIKFALAMCGVILSSIVILVGLKIYKKIFVDKRNTNIIKDEILKTPRTTEEAINFFINKNKLN